MSVRVVARIRPLLNSELDKDTIVSADSTEDGRHATLVKIPNPKNEAEEFSFAFNSVYDQETSQEELFNAEGTPSPSRPYRHGYAITLLTSLLQSRLT
ncbi:putative kinesin heavy chain protein [Phaeoacremonium minimum UCRPA7]|uniref:Putative kinesin heavy chain protein n=1 Tax=Phaeoacremonium minimum (strain UCR-PA7) TaxID=1286976 RepID=R8BMM9_PHAM7|nr:putative kinesin heavy chain protein [Phaeoacremonium minimum UCRPA7]EOO00611.1 putative kinesin heavy chain protein [Phaeoacremonium minimum UCRPA7]